METASDKMSENVSSPQQDNIVVRQSSADTKHIIPSQIAPDKYDAK